MYRLDDRDGDGCITNNDNIINGHRASSLQYGLTISGITRISTSTLYSVEAHAFETLGLSSYAGLDIFTTFQNCILRTVGASRIMVTTHGIPNTEWNSGLACFVRVNRAGSSHNATIRTTSPTTLSATYLRLKTVELGYTFKPALLNKVGIKSARLYVNGGNLHTFCNKLQHIDLK